MRQYVGLCQITPRKFVRVSNPGVDQDIKSAIETAYNLANDGDILLIPSGTFKFIGTLTFTKLISLRGAGKNQTILYRPETIVDTDINGKAFFYFNINQKVNSNIIISDFTIKSKIPEDLSGTTGSVATDYGIRMYCGLNFKVYNCRFENFGHSGISVRHYDDSIGGLIYNNEFIHCAKGPDGLGLGYGVSVYGEDTWKVDPQFGTSNFIFIEDNYFEMCRHETAGGGSGCYVARHNEMKNSMYGHAIDMHEARGISPNLYSTRACEIYNNTVYNTIFKDGSPVYNYAPYMHWGVVDGEYDYNLYTTNGGYVLSGLGIGIRGGESVIYNNDLSYFRLGIKLYNGEDGIDNMLKVNIWNNTLESYGSIDTPYNIPFEVETPDTIIEGVHYFLEEKAGYTPYVYPHPLRN